MARDGECVWPEAGSEYPPCVLRTFRDDEQIELVFGSCRVAAPHEPPYTLPKSADPENGRGFDAFHALARSILESEDPRYPDLVFWCGDQVYADEVSIETQEFIEGRADRPAGAPSDQVADFSEYASLYREPRSEPVVRWLLSTVSSAMVIDDYDLHDDWNISRAWCEQIEELPWWSERVAAGLMSYWVYQFTGNLSPAELREMDIWNRVQDADGDAGPILREWVERSEAEGDGKRWSYVRDIGTTRLIVIDARLGRCLEPGKRRILDPEEERWVAERATEREVDHLLLGTSDPYLLAPSFHHLEAWNERVCDGRWGSLAANLGERMRQALDFDHWAAFGDSFGWLRNLIEEIGSGDHGRPPATIGVLSGDVHHAYLADVAFRRGSAVESVVYQAVGSPYRNALDDRERKAIGLAQSPAAVRITHGLARAAGVPDPGIRWRFRQGPYFDNQVATLKLDGRDCDLELHKVPRDDEGRDERLERLFTERLS